jgi:hypothetical protein
MEEQHEVEKIVRFIVFIMVTLDIVVRTANVWLEMPSTRTPNAKPHLRHLYVEELDGFGQRVYFHQLVI